ncbi:FMN reductase [Rhizobium oryziradicis]|uniref:FMN reductase n=1 Tax=Rhizobium oryziradicis TaxID=1867956 RepID=A0A1Q8ZXG1_9HYPH|nr:FMN reductase [Rhizobium oryziradicis]OLP46721.1 FMN reductase [Rhizobium oryziradicis]
MTFPDVVGLAGSFSVPSKTRALVEDIVARAVEHFDVTSKVIDLSQFGPDLGNARSIDGLTGVSRDIVDNILNARTLIIAAPVYKGSYPGLFKHLFDLIDPAALAGKPILLVATGGGEKHALVIEHQLRPLFGFFEALTLPIGIYASEVDFVNGQPVSPRLIDRINRAVEQLEPHLAQRHRAFDNVVNLARPVSVAGNSAIGQRI